MWNKQSKAGQTVPVRIFEFQILESKENIQEKVWHNLQY